MSFFSHFFNLLVKIYKNFIIFINSPKDISNFVLLVENLKEIIKKVILFLIGISIISYIFYIRLILERIPHKIDFSFNIYKFLLYLILFIIFAYLVKQKIYPKTSKNIIIIFFKEYSNPIYTKLKEIYKTSLFVVHDFFISDGRIKINLFLHECILKIDKIYSSFSNEEDKLNYTFPILIYCFFVIIPRYITIIALFVDIIIFNEFYYFYKLFLDFYIFYIIFFILNLKIL